jgi:uncharacterized cupin superfamily protein
MPKIEIDRIPVDAATRYPAPYSTAVVGRSRQRLGNAAGLDQFGVNLTRLAPGASSSHRHWHRNEDEFVYVLQGEVVLIEDAGETVLKPGDAAAWKAGVGDGHCLINRSDAIAILLEVGTRAAAEEVVYSDIDMKAERVGARARYLNKSGNPFPGSEA